MFRRFLKNFVCLIKPGLVTCWHFGHWVFPGESPVYLQQLWQCNSCQDSHLIPEIICLRGTWAAAHSLWWINIMAAVDLHLFVLWFYISTDLSASCLRTLFYFFVAGVYKSIGLLHLSEAAFYLARLIKERNRRMLEFLLQGPLKWWETDCSYISNMWLSSFSITDVFRLNNHLFNWNLNRRET